MSISVYDVTRYNDTKSTTTQSSSVDRSTHTV